MTTTYLLPNKYKLIGWILFGVGLITGMLMYTDLMESEMLKTKVLSIYHDGFFAEKEGFFKIIENGILDEIVAAIIIIGGLLVGFTKEKVEDEFIYQHAKRIACLGYYCKLYGFTGSFNLCLRHDLF